MDFSQKDPSSHWDTFSIDREECCSKAFSSQLHLKNGRSSLIIIWICPHSSKTWYFGGVTSPPNLLDQIFTQQLSDAQHELLLAFSVYRESVVATLSSEGVVSSTSGSCCFSPVKVEASVSAEVCWYSSE